MPSLLPPNRTSLEDALGEISERATTTTAPLHWLWDPYNCPLRLLPWLAWALGVGEWSADWPESRQREVVANALAVRRRAGTAGAVRTAVESLDIEGIEYREWWEYGGDPYTYRITATLETRGMDQAQYDELVRVIERASRLSAWLDPVGFTVIGRGQYSYSAVTLGGATAELRPYTITERTQSHRRVSGATGRSLATTDLRPWLVTSVTQNHPARMGIGTRAAAWTAVYPPQ